VTKDGLRRFFEALTTHSDHVLHSHELQEAFQRTLKDFGVWEGERPEFRQYWKKTWAEMLLVLTRVVHGEKSSGSAGGEARRQGDTFCFGAFAGVLRRLKLELALRVWEKSMGPRVMSLASRRSIVEIDIDEGKRGRGGSGEQGGNGQEIPEIPGIADGKWPRRLSALYNLEEEEVVLKTYVWNARRVQGLDVTRRNMRDFFLGHRDPEWRVRWVIADWSDRANIIRLSIKYRFHPLHLEDVLKLERQQPRFLKYGGHYFLILPLLRLVRDAAEAKGEHSTRTTPTSLPDHETPSKKEDRWKAAASHDFADIALETSRLAIFAAGPPHFDTIITIHGAWQRVRNRCCSLEPPTSNESVPGKRNVFERMTAPVPIDTAACAAIPMEAAPSLAWTHDTFSTPSIPPLPGDLSSAPRSGDKPHALNPEDSTPRPMGPTSVLGAAFRLLHEDYSSVRHGNSNWMLHTILETITKMIIPIMALYETRLLAFQRDLNGPDAPRMRERLSKPIMDVKHDLISLQQRIKSMLPVLRGLISEPSLREDEALFYIQGVHDDLHVLYDDINTMLVLAQSLLDESKYLKDDTRNEALKLFAVVTALFCPLQFIAGYFGTNFVGKARAWPRAAGRICRSFGKSLERTLITSLWHTKLHGGSSSASIPCWSLVATHAS
jgi:Mg2+ and Co2+ transporter CorA